MTDTLLSGTAHAIGAFTTMQCPYGQWCVTWWSGWRGRRRPVDYAIGRSAGVIATAELLTDDPMAARTILA